MSPYPIEVGRVAQSVAGRDKGRYFLIVEVQDEFALISDGEMRKIEKPKRKRCKHLHATQNSFENLQEKLASKKKVFDSEIRKSLESLGYNKPTPAGEEE